MERVRVVVTLARSVVWVGFWLVVWWVYGTALAGLWAQGVRAGVRGLA